jgi:hypothetical protein
VKLREVDVLSIVIQDIDNLSQRTTENILYVSTPRSEQRRAVRGTDPGRDKMVCS